MTEFLLLFVLLFLSAFFSGSETALTALSRGRAEALAKEQRRGARALATLKREPQRMLVGILIGNNVVNIGASALATVIATRELGRLGPGLAVGVLTILVLVFGEITPKSIATRYSERISLIVAPIILTFLRLITPLVWLFQGIADLVDKATPVDEQDPIVTESELISMVGFGQEEGTIEKGEKELIERAFAFSDLAVSDVMTPRHRVFALDSRQTIGAAMPRLIEAPYSRIPLHQDDIDEIVKVLYLRDVLVPFADGRNTVTLGEVARPPYFVPDSQTLTDTIAALRRESQHLAVVVDEHGTMEGVVTLEDLLEELVGEIYDESDVKPQQLSPLGTGRAIVDGSSELRVIGDFFGVELSGKPTDSVSRWILEHARRIPGPGEVFELDGLQVTVQQASQRRIQEVLVCRPKIEPGLQVQGIS